MNCCDAETEVRSFTLSSLVMGKVLTFILGDRSVGGEIHSRIVDTNKNCRRLPKSISEWKWTRIHTQSWLAVKFSRMNETIPSFVFIIRSNRSESTGTVIQISDISIGCTTTNNFANPTPTFDLSSFRWMGFPVRAVLMTSTVQKGLPTIAGLLLWVDIVP